MTEIVKIEVFDGATAEADCNAWLADKRRSTIIEVTSVYNTSANELNFIVSYIVEV